MFYTNNFFKKFFTFVALIAVFGIGILSILGSGNSVSSGFSVNLGFPVSLPRLFWYRDGDGEWVRTEVTQSSFSFDITDQDYEFATIGLYNGMRLGYYFAGTIDEIDKHNIFFDDTSTKTSLQFSGTISNMILAYLYWGKNFLGNQFAIFSAGPYTYVIEVDEDDPTIGDVLVCAFNFGVFHYKFFNDVDLSQTPTNIDYIADPFDSAITGFVDVNGVFTDPGYLWFSNILFTRGLAANLGTDNMNTLVPVNKLATLPSGGIYGLFAEAESTVDSKTIIKGDYKFRTDSDGADFNEGFANDFPNIKYSIDTQFAFRALFGASYDHGLGDNVTKAWWKIETDNKNTGMMWYLNWTPKRSFNNSNGAEDLRVLSSFYDADGITDADKIGDSGDMIDIKISSYSLNDHISIPEFDAFFHGNGEVPDDGADAYTIQLRTSITF
jgi:hypothetical protein